jgi:hypothetical protein
MGFAELAAADVGVDAGIDELRRLTILLVGIQGYRGVIHEVLGMLRSEASLPSEF